MAALNDNLRALRPDLTWDRGERMRGDAAARLRRGRRRAGELADLDDLLDQLGQEHPGATLDDVDVETVRAGARPSAPPRTCAALQQLERELERQGWLIRGARRARADARRRCAGSGQTALRKVFDAPARRRPRRARPARRRRGRRDHRGLAGLGVRRRAAPRRRPHRVERACGATRSDPAAAAIGLAVEDFEVVETERRASAPRSRCASTCRSRWSPRAAGAR